MGDIFEKGKDKEVAPAPPKKKRPLFTKSASTRAVTTKDAVDFFSRGKDLFPQILHEEQRKREKKLEKLERKRSTTSAETRSCTPPGGKRRRVTPAQETDGRRGSDTSQNEEDHPLSRRESSNSTPRSRESRPGSSQTKAPKSPTTLSGRYSRDLQSRKQEASKTVEVDKDYITVSDSDSESEVVTTALARNIEYQPSNPITRHDEDFHSSPRKPAPPPPPPIEDDFQMSEDEEFPELVLKARERARQKALQKEQEAKAFTEKNHASSGGVVDLDDDDDIFERGPRTKRNLDPVVEIFISSQIEGSQALRVQRKLSGRLKEVRLSWCDKQISSGVSMGPNLKERIFLTWRGRKLFDSTSCHALGLKVDDSGKLCTGDGVDALGRVHLEAWTEDAFNVYQKKVETREQRIRDNSIDADSVEEQKEEPVKKIRLIMKARNMEFKLVVKPNTTIERMIQAFRDGKEIPEGKAITLHWDGDKLDEDTTVGETDLEDLDNIEVHIE